MLFSLLIFELRTCVSKGRNVIAGLFFVRLFSFLQRRLTGSEERLSIISVYFL